MVSHWQAVPDKKKYWRVLKGLLEVFQSQNTGENILYFQRDPYGQALNAWTQIGLRLWSISPQ